MTVNKTREKQAIKTKKRVAVISKRGLEIYSG